MYFIAATNIGELKMNIYITHNVVTVHHNARTEIVKRVI